MRFKVVFIFLIKVNPKHIQCFAHKCDGQHKMHDKENVYRVLPDYVISITINTNNKISASTIYLHCTSHLKSQSI